VADSGALGSSIFALKPGCVGTAQSACWGKRSSPSVPESNISSSLACCRSPRKGRRLRTDRSRRRRRRRRARPACLPASAPAHPAALTAARAQAARPGRRRRGRTSWPTTPRPTSTLPPSTRGSTTGRRARPSCKRCARCAHGARRRLCPAVALQHRLRAQPAGTTYVPIWVGRVRVAGCACASAGLHAPLLADFCTHGVRCVP